MRRRERVCNHAEGHWVGLLSLDQFEALPWCPRCGPVDRLTSGPLSGDELPEVLFCGGCGDPLVALG
jgi:hypothetical protein